MPLRKTVFLVACVLGLTKGTVKDHEGWWGLEEEAEFLKEQDFLERVGQREGCGARRSAYR